MSGDAVEPSTFEEIAGTGKAKALFGGAGAWVELIEAVDWAATPLGAIETWPETLRAAVNLVVTAPLPMQLFVGPAMTVIYNEALLPFMEGKHPLAMGRPGRVVWAEAWEQVGEQLEMVLRSGQPQKFTAVCIPLFRSGVLEEMYWDYAYIPVYGPDGEVLGILNVAQNVTAAVRSREELRLAEAESRRILQSIGDAVIVTDVSARVARMNPVAEELTGWSEAQARGVPLAEVFSIVNESTREVVENPADKVKRLGTIVGLMNHTVLLQRDGGDVHIEDSAAPITGEDGSISGIVLIFRDIGERRRLERERQRVSLELKAILDAMPALVSFLDTDLRYVRVNRVYEEWFGKREDEMLGRTVDEVLGLEAAERVRAHLQAALAGNQQRLEYQMKTGDRERMLSVAYVPRRDEQGNVIGIVVQGHDITEQKKAEQALMQSEKLAVVGRLAASIAHEINNPLESVTNLLFLAREGTHDALLQQYLDTADRELRRVASITSQTLRFHRQSTRATAVNGVDLIENVVTLYQGRLVNARVRVEQMMRAHKPVLCFEGEIRQVLNNLIANGIDAMQGSGGRLLLRSTSGRDWQTGRLGVMLTVADTGPGMPREVVARAFEAFFTTKGIRGSGLGLWISKEILERHRGRLRLRTSEQAGRSFTVVRVFLPYEAAVREGF